MTARLHHRFFVSDRVIAAPQDGHANYEAFVDDVVVIIRIRIRIRIRACRSSTSANAPPTPPLKKIPT